MEAEALDSEPARGSRRRWLALGGVAAAGIAAFLAFGVFGVQTLIIDDEVNESGPTFASGAQSGATVTTDPEATDPEATVATTAPVPEVITVAAGSFVGVDHPGVGSVTLLSDGSQTFVRFEADFATDNGPDLYAVAYVGDERIELGVLKGNQGAQNYELPGEIDPTTVTTVSVWCKRFDSTFTEAALT
jgi:hypothetical protein